MKYVKALLILILLTSCNVTETINLNQDGTGTIEVVELRDENSYMQLVGEKYSQEERFQDTTFYFQDYITKYNETFVKYPPVEQKLFLRYADVKLHIKKSSFEKEFRSTFNLKFNKISEIPDLYKTENYADDIRYNYALAAENHYYKIEYDFDGTVFKRKVLITSAQILQQTKDRFKELSPQYAPLKLAQAYILNYHFTRKIKSVSNSQAVLSSDKKSIKLEFQLSDAMQNPESTNLEVVLE